MAVLDPSNPLQRWILTPEESEQGRQLTITQKQCIQNQIVDLCLERLNMKLSPDSQLENIQRDAELKGQIMSLQYLIELSNQPLTEENHG